MRKIFIVFLLCFFVGCGYKPLAHYAKEAFGKSVYVDVKIHPDFPKAGVKIKDILNHALVSRLHLSIKSAQEAESILSVEVSGLSFDMISEDTQGFANHYRANVSVSFSYKSIYGEQYQKTLSGSSDYSATNSMTSIAIERSQINAINSALQQVINQFVSRIFYDNVTHQKQKALQNEH